MGKHIHKLKEVKEGEPFECNNCRVMGFGARHQCRPCNFILHSYCATCPSTLTSPVHPQHKLKLLDATKMPLDYSCNICNHNINGIFYHCVENCNFDAHPLCLKYIADHPPPQPSPPSPWHQPYPYGYAAPFGGPSHMPNVFAMPIPDYTPYVLSAIGAYNHNMNMYMANYLGQTNSYLHGLGNNNQAGTAMGIGLIGGAAKLLASMFGVPMM